MKLHGSYTSPYVRHCRIVLLETAQPFEFIETDQAGSSLKSPTQRVPILNDGQLRLTDSAAIIKYLREQAGQQFCATAQALDRFCLVNTALDATANVFFLERDGVARANVPYLQRQVARVDTILAELNQLDWSSAPPYDDAQLRLACFLAWARFRQRLDFSVHKNLEALLALLEQEPHFQATRPPQ